MTLFSAKFLRIILVLILPLCSFAQKINLNTEKKGLSIYKRELIFGLGATQYIGDVGGSSSGDFAGAEYGTKQYGVANVNIKTTSFFGCAGYRFRFNKLFATTGLFNFGMIRENDALGREMVKRFRNLHFRTFIVDYQQRLELTVLGLSKYDPETNVAKHTQQVYVFGGVGMCYFNPQAEYKGNWVDLKPLSTEGEGIKGTKIKPYSSFTPIAPVGFGVRFGFGELWRIGFEATYVKTFTDYLDDVSGVYIDPSILKSEAAKYLSNPASQNSNWFAPGQSRGNPNTKDSYLFLNFTLIKNITLNNTGKSAGKKVSKEQKSKDKKGKAKEKEYNRPI